MSTVGSATVSGRFQARNGVFDLVHTKGLIGGSATAVAGKVLQPSDSGVVQFVDASVGPYLIVLSNPSPGVKFTFILTVAGTQVSIAPATVSLLYGHIDEAAAGGPASFAAASTMAFTASALAGDRIEFIADASRYYVTAVSGAAGGVTAV